VRGRWKTLPAGKKANYAFSKFCIFIFIFFFSFFEQYFYFGMKKRSNERGREWMRGWFMPIIRDGRTKAKDKPSKK